ncbi:DUF3574 domain-containing protein [Kribbella sp. NPDC026596]|uniref:DUF3574 domain-containing protein n=1 Tax=Kribbella sp. NPDC026596 TaxID=3155122 RepID=UPI0033E86C60
MMHLGKTTAAAALVMTALAAPAAVALQQSDDKPAGVRLVGDTWVRTELFFGTDKPGPDVTDYQFSRFVNDTVTPRFPDGLTVLAGNGHWKDSDTGQIVKERSKVVIILYPVDGADDSSRKIEEIRDAYEKKFQQQSVLRTDSTEQVSF